MLRTLEEAGNSLPCHAHEAKPVLTWQSGAPGSQPIAVLLVWHELCEDRLARSFQSDAVFCHFGFLGISWHFAPFCQLCTRFDSNARILTDMSQALSPVLGVLGCATACNCQKAPWHKTRFLNRQIAVLLLLGATPQLPTGRNNAQPITPNAGRNREKDMIQINRDDFETAEEYIKALEEQNAAMKAKANAGGAIRCKVSDKGGLSVYGLGRFPVTLYKSQWLRLFSHAEEIVTFLKDNDSSLKDKSDVAKAA